jgi:hypothetical protein
VNVELPKEQQEELERRQKARERAEAAAKAGPRRRVVAAAPHPPVSKLPEITPLVLLALRNQPAKPAFNLIQESDLGKIKPGQTRDQLLTALGKPSSISGISGLEDGAREIYTYHLTPQRTVAVRLQSGVVTAIQPN